MATITGLRSLIRSITSFIQWLTGFYSTPDSVDLLPSPILQFANFFVEYPVVFIFVVAVPLVGIGIGLLRRMLNA